jgi:hypothetical protein
MCGLTVVAGSNQQRWVQISRLFGVIMIGGLDWRMSVEELFGGVQL